MIPSRRAVREAARVAKPGAGLFVFTFSRNMLPAGTEPFAGEPFVFTEFSAKPQCFLTEAQLFAKLAAAGFTPGPAVPLREHKSAASRDAAGRNGAGHLGSRLPVRVPYSLLTPRTSWPIVAT